MKKFMSFLMAAMLVVSCMGSVAFATEAPVVTVTQTAATETELTLSFSLNNNPGIKGYGLTIEYDETVMTLKSIEKGELSAGFFTPNVAEAYANNANTQVTTGVGVLFTAVFEIIDAKVGEHTVGVSGTVANAASEKVEVVVEEYTYAVDCEHEWDDGVVTVEPTCEEEGVMTYTCAICGETKIEAIAKTEHEWDDGVVTVEPTCEEEGVMTYTCAICGETKEEAIDALGHKWENGVCVNCGAKKSDIITPVGPSKDDEEEKEEITLPFTDVLESDWFYGDVVYVYENGLMNGMSATTFGPYGITTRGQIVTILYRLEGQPAVAGACPFTDVAAGSYYEAAITWAAANGIVTGYDATTFGPDDQITREQMAAILYRYAQGKGMASMDLADNLAAFTDADKISAYAVEAMNWAVGQGLINGMGDGTVAPQGQAIRAQAAAILHRFCETLQLI